MTRHVLKVGLGLVPLALLLVTWQILGRPDDPRFPPPTEWASALVDLNASGLILPALQSTTAAFLAALAVSTLLGAFLGLVIGVSRGSGRALGPLLEVLRITPPPALIPILVLLIGTNTTTIVVVVVFAAMWPIVFNTASAVQSIPSVRIEMSRSLGLSARDRITKVIVPSLVPGIALGVRIATPLCLVVVLVAEMLTSTAGVGQLLIERQRAYDAAAVFGLVAVVGAIGLTVNATVNLVESSLSRNFSSGTIR